MPAIKYGYSKAHDEHPSWLWVPAFQCHVRVTVLNNVLGWVMDSNDVDRYSRKRMWLGWFLQMNGRYEKGNKLWGKGSQRMYHGLEKLKKPNVNLVDLKSAPGDLVDAKGFPVAHNFRSFKNRGVLFAVHWYNEKVGICIIGSEPYADGKKVYCFKGGGYYPLLKSNLIGLGRVFDKLGWDVEMRFNWMQLALSQDLENSEMAREMLKAYFNEISENGIKG